MGFIVVLSTRRANSGKGGLPSPKHVMFTFVAVFPPLSRLPSFPVALVILVLAPVAALLLRLLMSSTMFCIPSQPTNLLLANVASQDRKSVV